MAKPELGGKHKCQNCGAKFFDLNKTPITCPKCGTTLEATSAATTSRSARESADDEEETEAEGSAEVVSLEDADATEDGKVTTAEDDEETEEEDTGGGDDDDTFLEEDEEDSDNVSDLIDGDIEDDEER